MATNQFSMVGGSTLQGVAAGSTLGVPGMIIGGALGATKGIMDVNADKRLREKNEKLRLEEVDMYNSYRSQVATDKYEIGKKSDSLMGYYKLGGSLLLDGGKLNRLFSGGYLATGNTHEQGGINLGGNEIESGEVVIGDKVFSDSIGKGGVSFASKAKSVGNEMGKMEEDLLKVSKDRNKYKYNSLSRNLELKGKELLDIYSEQENSKLEGINSKILEFGGELDGIGYDEKARINIYPRLTDYSLIKESPSFDITSYATKAKEEFKNTESSSKTENVVYKNTDLRTPMGQLNKEYKKNNRFNFEGMDKYSKALVPLLSDNIGGLLSNQRLRNMEVPKPMDRPFVDLKTDVNINPQLKSIDEYESKLRKNILSNTASSQTALSRMNELGGGVLDAKAKLYGDKENKETELTNQQRLLNSQITDANMGRLEQYRNTVFGKDIQTEITNPSANIDNLSRDLTYIQNMKNVDSYQEKQIISDLQKYPAEDLIAAINTLATDDNFSNLTMGLITQSNYKKIMEHGSEEAKRLAQLKKQQAGWNIQ